jgi:Tfp pilus assembly protein PilP
MRKNLAKYLVLLLVVFVAAGCGGLPDEVLKKAKAYPEDFKQAEELIKAREADYAALQKSDQFKTFLSPYAAREKWNESFAKARQRLAEAKQIADNDLKPILKRNKKEDLNAALAQMKRVGLAKKEAGDFAWLPLRRADFIKKARAEAPAWKEKAKKEAEEASIHHRDLQSFVSASQGKHPQKKDDIAGKFSPFAKAQTDSQKALSEVEKEFKSPTPDYALFADSCTLITKSLEYILKNEKGLQSRLSQLDRSYSKTLVDMRAEYYVQVGRVSWEESELVEWPTETDHAYGSRQVDAETYEYFANLPEDNELAHLRSFFGTKFSLEDGVDQGQWSKLKIEPKENWPSGDNEADYYITELPAKFFHKYLIIENGVKSETGWVEVNEDLFEASEDNLNMDIVSKPYGMYEEETLKTAAPPGLAYVGNPSYGTWKTDHSGSRFWEFYGQYRFFTDLIGGNRYSYGEHDSWNRDYRGRKPYYGPQNEEDERYGSGSATTQSRYAGSHYARSGGFKGSDHSVRGAGPRARGGGPGGGGK